MKRSVIASILGLSLAFGGLALAQDKKGKDKNSVSGYQKSKKYSFEDEDVNGQLLKPEGDVLAGRTDLKHASLIRVRTNFIKEIVKSAEDL